MKSRRIPSLLAAAVICRLESSVESASVRGVVSGGSGLSGSGRKRRNPRPRAQHHDQHQHQHQPDQHQDGRQDQRRASLNEAAQQQNPNRRDVKPSSNGSASGSDNNNNSDSDSPYWWHENESNQKDIAIVNHTPNNPDSTPDDGLQQFSFELDDGTPNKPDNALDDGNVGYSPGSGSGMEYKSGSNADGDNGGGGGNKNKFSVFAIEVNNNPDTSHLPYRQPSRTPTNKPTKSPTSKPTPQPVEPTPPHVPHDASNTMVANSATSETLWYYPLWSTTFKGCASSATPPSHLVNTQTFHSGVQYLFTNLEDCCSQWFEHVENECLESEVEVVGGEEDELEEEEMEEMKEQLFSTGSSEDQHAISTGSNPKPTPSTGGQVGVNPSPTPPATVVTPKPTLQSAAASDLNPTTPTFSSIVAGPADETVPAPEPTTPGPSDNPTNFETPWPTLNATESQWGNLGAFSNLLSTTPSPTTYAPTPAPSTYAPSPFPTTDAPTPYPTTMLEGLKWVHDAEGTTILYQESFDGGSIPLGNSNQEYFAWSTRGNGQWNVNEVLGQDSYDGKWHVATTGGTGLFALESVLQLTIGGVENGWYDSLLSHPGGGYVTFGINTDASFESGDSLVFRVDDTILGYWIDPNEGWERLNVYLPPSLKDVDGDGWDDANREGMIHELTWTYSYFGSQNVDNDRSGVVQLDGLMIEATTGDLLVSDDDLLAMQSNPTVIPAVNLHHSTGDVGWEVKYDNNAFVGSYVLTATTRRIIRAVNEGTITTFSGQAVMSFTIITGPYGGVLHFYVLSQVNTPIDVLEIGIDGAPVNAIIGPSENGWESHSVEVPQGKHVITFSHISNPADLSMNDLEYMGSPGSSKVDGLRYVDHIDPTLLTPSPTGSPTPEPSASPTPYSIPPQNYCGTDLASIQSKCYTENPPLTCNPSDGQGCPLGLLCWGNVSCDIPVGYSMAWMYATPPPTPEPTPNRVLPPQNYCGKGLANIRNTCYMEDAQTCNDDDGPCPHGTFCWGNIACEVPEDYVPPEPLNNYCGLSLASIKATCASGNLPTCNDGDPQCPSGTYCWGQVECDPIDGMGLMSDQAVTPQPTPKPTPEPVLQNYCGKNLPDIRATCASGDLPTCNDDDGPCPSGTYCWGQVKCDPIETTTPNPTPKPTPNPTEETIESFLSSFFSSNSGGQKEDLQEDQDEIASWSVSTPQEEEATPQLDVQQALQVGQGNCDEGLSPVQGLPNCCVPDPSFLGDGACDAYAPYNTQECGYDLGDCCKESCNANTPFACAAKEGDAYGPFGFYCLDPRYGSIDEDACGAENREWVGDGGCDPEYNTAECGWDGGDCCRQSCDAKFAYYECGREAQPFDCKNPDIIYRADYIP